MEKFTCTICYEDDIENVAEYGCGHCFCIKCVLVRFITQKLYMCPICKIQSKANNKCVIRGISQNINPRMLHQYKKYDGLYYQPESKIQLDRIMQPNCPKCNMPFDNFKQMVQHAKTVENIQYCQICVHYRPCLPIDQIQYTDKNIRSHIQTHPLCLICNKRQFDQQSLDSHLLTDHCRCELCANRGVTDSYWIDTKALFLHYRQEHFQCKFCSSHEFTIAFGTEKELLEHQLQDHITQLSSKQISEIRNKITELNKEGISLNEVIRLKELYSLKSRVQNKYNEHKQQKRTVDEFGHYVYNAASEDEDSESPVINGIQENIEYQQAPQLQQVTNMQHRIFEDVGIHVIQKKQRNKKQNKYFSAYDYNKQQRQSDENTQNQEDRYEYRQDHTNDNYYETCEQNQQQLVNYIKLDDYDKEQQQEIQNDNQFDDQGMFTIKKTRNKSKGQKKFYAYENRHNDDTNNDERLNADEYFNEITTNTRPSRTQNNEVNLITKSNTYDDESSQQKQEQVEEESNDGLTGLMIVKGKRKNKQKKQFNAFDYNKQNNNFQDQQEQKNEEKQVNTQNVQQQKIQSIDFGQAPAKPQFKVYVDSQTSSRTDKQEIRNKYLILINTQTYGKVANEICIILSLNGTILAQVIINFRYSDEFLQNKNFDQKLLQKQAKNQGIPPFKKQSYQQVQDDQSRYLVKNENDFDKIQKIFISVFKGKMKKIHKLSQEKIEGVQIKYGQANSENIQDFNPQIIYIQYSEQEYDQASGFMSQYLKISGIKIQKFSDFWNKSELEKNINNLDVYFKRQYCQHHAQTKPQRCAYDWVVRGMEMLNK